MKIILSRKGTDSASGGVPGIILPDGTIVAVPIPGDKCEEMTYNDVIYNSNCDSLYSLLNKLTNTLENSGQKINLTKKTKCHLDPDINTMSLPRMKGWRGCFGQLGTAQTVLENQNIENGDIFIFFGWFKKTYYDQSGKLKFCKRDGFHMIYGWLEIDSILYTSNTDIKVPEWLKYHPHFNQNKVDVSNNCIYIGKENLSFNSKLNGYGVFENYSDLFVLTKEGMTRSKWNLPSFFKDVNITYHSESSWKENYFQSAYRGQEFVCEQNSQITEWAKDIILTGTK